MVWVRADYREESHVVNPDFEEHNYRILRELGEGGQSKVWLAECIADDSRLKLSSGDKVALKGLPWNGAYSERELEILSKIEHPNIVRFIGQFNNPHIAGQILVMEYLEGEDLSEVLDRKGHLPWVQAHQIIHSCLDALVYLSGQNISHRDIKPSNIFLTSDGETKLIDFGIAREEGGETTQAGGFVGSLKYKSPDIILDEKEDSLSDLYSLGLCLFYALSGKSLHEFSGTSEFFTYWSKPDNQKFRWTQFRKFDSAKDWEPLRHAIILIPPLKEIFERCLAPLRADRYASLEEWKAVFDSVEYQTLTFVHPDKSTTTYDLTGVLGVGGFGVVYKGQPRDGGEAVAVKVLQNNKYEDRFKKEAAVLADVQSSYNVKYIGFFEDKSSGMRPFSLLMELLPGMPDACLQHRIRSARRAAKRSKRHGGLPRDEVMVAFGRYLIGLGQLHDKNIIHRDIKPANLYAPEGRPEDAKIFDLGIVRDTEHSMTQGGAPGTTEFMAPQFFGVEPYVNEGYRGCPGSDIFAIGISFYLALTATYPFTRLRELHAKDYFAVPMRFGKERPISFDHPVFQPETGEPRLKPIIERCLKFALSERYSNVNDILEDLWPLLESRYESTQLEHFFPGEYSQSVNTSKTGLSLTEIGTSQPTRDIDPFALRGISKRTYQLGDLQETMADARRYDGTYQGSRSTRPLTILEILPEAHKVHVQRTYRLLKEFKSKFVVRFYDVASDAGGKGSYVIMPLTKGLRLSDRLEEKTTMELEEVLHLIQLYAQGLTDLHQVGVVHHGIQPENLLAEPTGEPDGRILNLGFPPDFARLAERKSAEDVARLQYLAPELATLPAGSFKADIFALGVCFHQMLTGKRSSPFPAIAIGEAADNLAQMQDKELAPTLNAAVYRDYPELAEIVSRSIHVDAEQRYTDAARMAQDVQEFEALQVSRSRSAPIKDRVEDSEPSVESPTGETGETGETDETGETCAAISDPHASLQPPKPSRSLLSPALKRGILLGVGGLAALLLIGFAALRILSFLGNQAESNQLAALTAATDSLVEASSCEDWRTADLTGYSSLANEAGQSDSLQVREAGKAFFDQARSRWAALVDPVSSAIRSKDYAAAARDLETVACIANIDAGSRMIELLGDDPRPGLGAFWQDMADSSLKPIRTEPDLIAHYEELQGLYERQFASINHVPLSDAHRAWSRKVTMLGERFLDEKSDAVSAPTLSGLKEVRAYLDRLRSPENAAYSSLMAADIEDLAKRVDTPLAWMELGAATTALPPCADPFVLADLEQRHPLYQQYETLSATEPPEQMARLAERIGESLEMPIRLLVDHIEQATNSAMLATRGGLLTSDRFPAYHRRHKSEIDRAIARTAASIAAAAEASLIAAKTREAGDLAAGLRAANPLLGSELDAVIAFQAEVASRVAAAPLLESKLSPLQTSVFDALASRVAEQSVRLKQAPAGPALAEAVAMRKLLQDRPISYPALQQNLSQLDGHIATGVEAVATSLAGASSLDSLDGAVDLQGLFPNTTGAPDRLSASLASLKKAIAVEQNRIGYDRAWENAQKQARKVIGGENGLELAYRSLRDFQAGPLVQGTPERKVLVGAWLKEQVLDPFEASLARFQVGALPAGLDGRLQRIGAMKSQLAALQTQAPELCRLFGPQVGGLTDGLESERASTQAMLDDAAFQGTLVRLRAASQLPLNVSSNWPAYEEVYAELVQRLEPGDLSEAHSTSLQSLKSTVESRMRSHLTAWEKTLSEAPFEHKAFSSQLSSIQFFAKVAPSFAALPEYGRLMPAILLQPSKAIDGLSTSAQAERFAISLTLAERSLPSEYVERFAPLNRALASRRDTLMGVEVDGQVQRVQDDLAASARRASDSSRWIAELTDSRNLLAGLGQKLRADARVVEASATFDASMKAQVDRFLTASVASSVDPVRLIKAAATIRSFETEALSLRPDLAERLQEHWSQMVGQVEAISAASRGGMTDPPSLKREVGAMTKFEAGVGRLDSLSAAGPVFDAYWVASAGRLAEFVGTQATSVDRLSRVTSASLAVKNLCADVPARVLDQPVAKQALLDFGTVVAARLEEEITAPEFSARAAGLAACSEQLAAPAVKAALPADVLGRLQAALDAEQSVVWLNLQNRSAVPGIVSLPDGSTHNVPAEGELTLREVPANAPPGSIQARCELPGYDAVIYTENTRGGGSMIWPFTFRLKPIELLVNFPAEPVTDPPASYVLQEQGGAGRSQSLSRRAEGLTLKLQPGTYTIQAGRADFTSTSASEELVIKPGDEGLSWSAPTPSDWTPSPALMTVLKVEAGLKTLGPLDRKAGRVEAKARLATFEQQMKTEAAGLTYAGHLSRVDGITRGIARIRGEIQELERGEIAEDLVAAEKALDAFLKTVVFRQGGLGRGALRNLPKGSVPQVLPPLDFRIQIPADKISMLREANFADRVDRVLAWSALYQDYLTFHADGQGLSEDRYSRAAKKAWQGWAERMQKVACSEPRFVCEVALLIAATHSDADPVASSCVGIPAALWNASFKAQTISRLYQATHKTSAEEAAVAFADYLSDEPGTQLDIDTLALFAYSAYRMLEFGDLGGIDFTDEQARQYLKQDLSKHFFTRRNPKVYQTLRSQLDQIANDPEAVASFQAALRNTLMAPTGRPSFARLSSLLSHTVSDSLLKQALQADFTAADDVPASLLKLAAWGR